MQTSKTLPIGIAGTGKMGSAMVARLLSQGHSVTVWNRTAARAQPLLAAGATWAATPRELVAQTDAVISMVSDEQALHEVYFSADGLLSGAVQGKLLIDMSTMSSARQAEMGQRVSATGAAYVECPVGGSIGPAKEGKLLGFAGGADADVQRALPLLNVLCRRVEHVGPHGAGAMMKLAINLPLMVYWQTLGEALSLIEPLGLDPSRVIDIFSESSGGPNMLKVRGTMIAQALAGDKNDTVTVNLGTMRKDVKSMLAQGIGQHRKMPLTAATLESFEAAARSGLDAADCTQLLVWWLGQGSQLQGGKTSG
jgi:3-hydroxyisobutyrate dehydrogenase